MPSTCAPAVDGDDRDAGLDRLLEGRRHCVDLIGADDDALDALGDRSFDVGGLLGRGHLPIAFDHGLSPDFAASP